MTMQKINIIIASMVFVLGAKLFIIKLFASDLPFWDQWDSEADFLYRPYILGDLNLEAMFSPHNEHRIFWSRLLGLALLEIFNVWSPIFQAAINSIIHVSALGIIVYTLSKSLNFYKTLSLSAFSIIVFSIPFGWENTLYGFQSQFYFMIGFSICSLLCFNQSSSYSLKWLFSIMFGVFSYFSMTSGVAALMSSLVFSVFEMLAERRKRNLREFSGCSVILFIVILMIYFTPSVAHHDSLKAQSIIEFYKALSKVLSWPFPNIGVTPILVFFPLILLIIKFFKEFSDSNSWIWAYILILIWLGVQCSAIAYGRATAPLSSRYMDLYLPLTVLNFGVALHLWRDSQAGRWIRLWGGTAFPLIVLYLAFVSGPKSYEQILERYALTEIQIENVNKFLTTGEDSYLTDKPFLHIPYPHADRLIKLLNDPLILSILNTELLKAPERVKSSLSSDYYSIKFGKVVKFFIKKSPAIMLLGFLYLCFAVVFGRKTSQKIN